MKHMLQWEMEFDDHDNTIWQAVGGSSDGESQDLYYRIKQELRGNMHVFVEDSDTELLLEPENGPREFGTLSMAKLAMNLAYNSALESSCLG